MLRSVVFCWLCSGIIAAQTSCTVSRNTRRPSQPKRTPFGSLPFPSPLASKSARNERCLQDKRHHQGSSLNLGVGRLTPMAPHPSFDVRPHPGLSLTAAPTETDVVFCSFTRQSSKKHVRLVPSPHPCSHIPDPPPRFLFGSQKRCHTPPWDSNLKCLPCETWY